MDGDGSCADDLFHQLYRAKVSGREREKLRKRREGEGRGREGRRVCVRACVCVREREPPWSFSPQQFDNNPPFARVCDRWRPTRPAPLKEGGRRR